MDTYNELIQEIKNAEPSRIVFWVGCGVDRNSPTNLPLGNELTNELLIMTCGDDVSKRIWKCVAKQKSEEQLLREKGVDYEEEYTGLRLETIIHEIKVFEKELQRPISILKGFKVFLEPPPNICHKVLAQYLRRGSNIVTTNFGNAISKAYQELYPDDDFPSEPSYNEHIEMNVYECGSEKCGKIYHVHGVANCIENMGMSLDIVSHLPSEGFEELLRQWLNNKNIFIFLGYSFSDTLDIYDLFERIKQDGIVGGLGININHSDTLKKPKNSVEPDIKANRNMGIFEQRMQFNIDTTVFLRNIQKEPLVIDREATKFGWKEKFLELADTYSTTMKAAMALGYIRRLVLNVDEVLLNWEEIEGIIKDRSEFKQNSWYIDYNATTVLSASDNPKRAARFRNQYLQAEDTLLAQSNVLFQKGRLRKAAKIWELDSIACELDDRITNERSIQWDISTPLNRYAALVIRDCLMPIFGKIFLIKYKRTIQSVMNLNEKILNERKLVYEPVQILTAMRYNGVLYVLKNRKNIKKDAPSVFKEARKNVRKAMSLYKDISIYAGTYRCKQLLAIIELFNFRFSKDVRCLKKCDNYLKELRSSEVRMKDKSNRLLYYYIKLVREYDGFFY